MRWTAIMVLLMALLAGCSTVRLSYNQGPFLAYWWLDGYADFNAEQSPKVKAALADWFAWHRASQLPEYAQALAELQALAHEKLSGAQVCSQMAAWQARAERAYEQAVPAIAEQLRSLTAEQIRRIERQQHKKLAEAEAEAEADYLQDDPADHHKALLKRNIDRAESLYGKLSPAQLQLLTQALAQTPFKPELWLAERRQRQQDILRQLRLWHPAPSEASAVQAGLRQLGTAALVSPRPAYQAHADAVAQAHCALSAALHNAAGAPQRQHAVDKLKGWEDDLRALSRR